MVENHEMQSMQDMTNRKRKFRALITPHELTHRFSSKLDLHIYMSEHRKYFLTHLLTDLV